jgi:Family of unknown function (DUF695)
MVPQFLSRLSALWPKSASRTVSVTRKGGEQFSVFESEMEGRPLIATINVGLRGLESKAAHPWFLSLSTPLIQPTKDGLPTPGDSTALSDWEAFVEKRINPACQFVFVGHVTWNGSREVLYYIDRVEPTATLLKRLRDDHLTRPFAFRCERDDAWNNVSVYFRQSG